MTAQFDIAIVGAGMAGASLAAEIGSARKVLLLEAEEQPGYHSTGRSAAFWSETYGGPLIQPLTTASGPFLSRPPPEFAEEGFLRARGALHIADEAGRGALDAMLTSFKGSGVQLEGVDEVALQRRLPGAKRAWVAAVLEKGCADIDVAGLHAAYLKAARRQQVLLLPQARLRRASRIQGGWKLETSSGECSAAILVDAAGAWADEVARLAGVAPVGVQPYRRTIVQLRVDPPAPPDLPLVVDANGHFYFKPEPGGRLWLSPHDESPCDPCDSAPEEYDVALAIERFQQVVDWKVERVEHSWAGLRSFAPDRLPVFGFAWDCPCFFWFAGQGGFGIQTAPAASKLAASLLLGRQADALIARIDPSPYLAERFAN